MSNSNHRGIDNIHFFCSFGFLMDYENNHSTIIVDIFKVVCQMYIMVILYFFVQNVEEKLQVQVLLNPR